VGGSDIDLDVRQDSESSSESHILNNQRSSDRITSNLNFSDHSDSIQNDNAQNDTDFDVIQDDDNFVGIFDEDVKSNDKNDDNLIHFDDFIDSFENEIQTVDEGMVPELDDIFLSNLNENFIESIERDIFINAFATSLDACYVLCKHIRECKEDSVTFVLTRDDEIETFVSMILAECLKIHGVGIEETSRISRIIEFHFMNLLSDNLLWYQISSQREASHYEDQILLIDLLDQYDEIQRNSDGLIGGVKRTNKSKNKQKNKTKQKKQKKARKGKKENVEPFKRIKKQKPLLTPKKGKSEKYLLLKKMKDESPVQYKVLNDMVPRMKRKRETDTVEPDTIEKDPEYFRNLPKEKKAKISKFMKI